MTAIDHLLVGGVEDFERRNDLTGGQRLDLDRAAGQLVHPFGEHPEVVLQGEARGPGRLHLERPRGGLLRTYLTGEA